MYETEANTLRQRSDQVPSDLMARFGELTHQIKGRTVLPWGEHCTECVWPSCYTTCDMYSPRADGRCRRFVDGMVRIDCPEAVNSYILKITFKRWAKLWTPGNIRIHPAKRARHIENRDFRIGSLLHQLPVPNSLRVPAIENRYKLKKKMASRPSSNGTLPDAFVLECVNPENIPVKLSFCIRAVPTGSGIPFQKLLVMEPGFNRARIECAEIQAMVDLTRPFGVEVIPNNSEQAVTLFFGLLDFVTDGGAISQVSENSGLSSAATTHGAPKIKCVVWDLDNTIWSGIVVEDGIDHLSLKPGIRDVLRKLDERGILHSIASKNNHDEAWAALKQLDLDEFFLAPQISWAPKSEAIRAIATGLNIGLDTLLFVDDSDFELQEVSTSLPEVRVIHADRYEEIPHLEACNAPITEVSRQRRQLYRVEAEREHFASRFGGNYAAFLRSCDIQMKITHLDDSNLERVHELTQRTNRMNFSGNRYDKDVLRNILNTPWLDTHVLEVEDRFGTYGIVGFAIVDSREPCITDLMFSCRIQSKRIEHAILTWILRKYGAARDVWALYRKTDRNASSGGVFADIGMQEISIVDDVSRMVFRHNNPPPPPDDGIVTIVEATQQTTV